MNNFTTNSAEGRQLHIVNHGELERISGGVAPVYDDKGNIIRTCTGPFPPIKGGISFPKKTPLVH